MHDRNMQVITHLCFDENVGDVNLNSAGLSCDHQVYNRKQYTTKVVNGQEDFVHLIQNCH